MTTTVTVKTHSWPVRAVITDEFKNGDYEHHGVTKEVVPPDTEKHFHLTNTRSIAFFELPIPDQAE
jgi:hypothetical protein